MSCTSAHISLDPDDVPEIGEVAVYPDKHGMGAIAPREPECAERLADALMEWARQERERRHLPERVERVEREVVSHG